MFIPNVNFDSGIANGRKGSARVMPARVLDIQAIAPGSPHVLVPRITFQVKVGAKGTTFHRRKNRSSRLLRYYN